MIRSFIFVMIALTIPNILNDVAVSEKMLWLVLVLVALYIFYIKSKKIYTFWEEKDVKYVKPRYLVGNMSIIPTKKTMLDRINDLYTAFPNERYMGMFEFFVPALMIRDADLVKQITIKDFDSFTDHKSRISVEDPLWSRSLPEVTGQKWHNLRATVSPTFTSSKMRSMFHLMENCAVQFVEHFKTKSFDVRSLEMKDIFSRYTNDVIASAAFGIECNSLKYENNEFYLNGKDATTFGFFRIMTFFCTSICPTLSKLLKLKIIPSRISKYFSKIFKETIKRREEDNIVRHDMVHLLMQAMKGNLKLDDEQLKVNEGFSSVDFDYSKHKASKNIEMDDAIAQAFIFFFAGFETASILLSFSSYELALHPEIQQRLRLEIQCVLEEGDNKVTYESLLGMKYLDNVISEVLRKWAPASMTDRVATKDYTIQPVQPNEKPLVIEKGTCVWIPINSLHYNEKYFPNPKVFDPDRFSDENKHNIHAGAYIPFGSGPRNCVGSRFALLEVKVLLFHILANFEIVPVKKTNIPMVLDSKRLNPISKDGMWLGFKKIK